MNIQRSPTGSASQISVIRNRGGPTENEYEPSRRHFLKRILWGAGLSVFGVLPSGCSGDWPLFGAPIQLPAPRPVSWRMKDLATAETELRILADGRLYLQIRHQVLHGVTPQMLVWWFSNLEGDIVVAGKKWPRYQIWHPVDHISIRYVRRRPDGGIGPGAKIHIREALGGRLDYLVDVVTTIEKLDDTGFVHGLRFFGLEVMRLEYTFTPVRDGTIYENSITFGPDRALLRPFFNAVIRPRLFSDDRARAWLKHNVEEVGNFEYFLPDLYASQATGRVPAT
jgi:DAPG hydrolase PhiG domain